MANWLGSFRGDLFFLSNFYLCKFTIDNVTYSSVEHFFVAMKNPTPEWINVIVNTPSASKAKALGRKVKLRKDWDEVQIPVMYKGLYNKFSQNIDLGNKLKTTPNELLVERNTWNDLYWGVDYHTGKGKNDRSHC
jgi:ribA/ribD-fused uncharacterized protein